ncbi:MAG: hypothetical protein LBH98_01900 [Chitinispirillales bacterium]|jgi:hypothetical protein|nr:hypothetical protein [Chitinispirillales bacterium]
MNTKFSFFENINLNVNFDVSFWIMLPTACFMGLFGLFIYYLKNPEKFEKLVALITFFLKKINEKFDKTHVKYDLQGKINDYLKQVSRKIKHLNVEKITIDWLDVDNQTRESYLINGQLILRLHKSENQNQNIVNASMAFIGYAFLKKAKSYVAKYQKESLDLYACYDLLKSEKPEILDLFVQDFMKEKMDNEKVAELFEKHNEINKVGLFYPVLVQELTFLGEKVFAKKRDQNKIYEEVLNLIDYLYNYSQRKMKDEIINDFNGYYCKFAIRIIGKKFKIETEGESVYINNLLKINFEYETLYLIGNASNKDFMKSVVNKCKSKLRCSIITENLYKATIKDSGGKDFNVDNYLVILRSDSIEIYHR